DAGNNGSFENTFYQGLGSLAVGNSLTASFNWTPGVAGTYGVESCADSANTVSELNENDNCSTQTFTVTGSGSVTPPPVIYPPIIYPPQQPSPIYIPAPQQPQIIYQPSPSPQIIYQSSPSPQIIYQPPASPQIIQYPSYPAYYSYPYPYQSTLPDLSVVEVNLSPNLPRVNRLVTITAAIRNNSGVMRVEQSEAGLRIDDQASNTEDVRLFYNVDFIQPGDYRAVTFYWTPTMTGNHRLELCADSGGRITESDESNNCSIQYINVNSDTAYLLPAVSLYSVPFNINRGENSTLVWNTTNAANCFASEGWSGNKAASGSETIYPVNTRTYFLTCYNSYGQNSANTTVYVNGTSAVSKNLTASCVASPGSTVVGRQVTFAAGESGAIGTPSYVWSGDISGIGIINRKTFSSAGSKTATITVTDSAGRTATAQCRTQVNSAAVAAAPAKIYKPRPTAPKTKDACQQYPPGATIYNYYYNNGQQATNCSAAALDSQTSEPTTPAGPAISQDKPIAAVLSLGLGDTGRFFFWFSMAMLNLFLMAALVYIFFYMILKRSITH
ncbi:MAG: hypothetical protein HYT38_01990, partial [Candidatus Sungbacteria bacterium]|nr:hypothetical protein [Candidatus Sungbacteria bacterium]